MLIDDSSNYHFLVFFQILNDIAGDLDAKKACTNAMKLHKKYLKQVGFLSLRSPRKLVEGKKREGSCLDSRLGKGIDTDPDVGAN